MKKTFLLLILFTVARFSFAQDTTTTRPSKLEFDLSNRGTDHLLIQFGADSWMGKPDSIRTKGFSRHFNVYFMLDKPFKTNPKLSVAYGVGIGSSNMFFDNTYVNLKATGTTNLPFNNVDSANHFKKFKLTTVYAEVPVELRWYSNPAEPSKSFKVAVGAKVGTMLKAYTKGKNLVNKNDVSLYGEKYIQKEVERKFFNGTKLAVHGRVGYGILGLHAQYQVTTLIKDGLGPEIRPFSIGLTIAGL